MGGMTTFAIRTDIHRPSAPEFDPQDYDWVGCYDFTPDEPSVNINLSTRQSIDARTNAGWSFSGVHGETRCDHCGAHLRYAALMAHRPTHTLIWVGETCLDNRFSLAKADFDRLRTASRLHRERQPRTERIDALVEAHPELTWLTYPEGLDNRFLGSLAYQLHRDGSLTERQVAAAGPALARDTERLNREAVAQANQVEAKPAPVGRAATVVGQIVSTRVQDGYCGRVEYKMLVLADDGWKAWGTIPASLFDGGNTVESLVGIRVSFVADLTSAGKPDPYFAIAKRPRQAEVLSWRKTS